MKSLVILFSMVTLSACFGQPSQRSPDSIAKPARSNRLVECKPSADAMGCLRANCQAAGAQFDETQRVCTCPTGSVLSTVGAYSCLPLDLEMEKPTQAKLLSASDGTYSYSVRLAGSTTGLAEALNESGAAFSLLPIAGRKQTIQILDGASAMRALGLDEDSLHDSYGKTFEISGFLTATDLNLPINANGGVRDAVADLPFIRTYTRPFQTAIATGDARLDEFIAKSLEQAALGLQNETYQTYTDFGCADQCIGKTALLDGPQFTSTRTRAFFSGGLVQDLISIFDKTQRRTAITMHMLGKKVANYILTAGDGATLYAANDASGAEAVAQVARFPDVTSLPLRQSLGSEIPVVLFEAADHQGAMFSSIVTGPWKNSHVFGWFKPEDGLPFLKNYENLPTIYGEEEIEVSANESAHGLNVAALATGDFKNPSIPFAGSDLLSGIFAKFARNYSEVSSRPLVASLSETWALSPKSCAESPIGQAITGQAGKILWVVSASNSGTSFDMNSNACPQTIVSGNLLKVAATAGDDRIASTSARGELTVDVAELGCPGNDDSCNPADTGTSFAAPRLARKIADLMTAYPSASPEDVAFAIKATARIPVYYGLQTLPVIAGGIADADAAGKLLSQRAKWPANKLLTSPAWLELLYQAKVSQYGNSWASTIRNYVRQQAALFMKRGKLQ